MKYSLVIAAAAVTLFAGFGAVSASEEIPSTGMPVTSAGGTVTDGSSNAVVTGEVIIESEHEERDRPTRGKRESNDETHEY